MDINQQIAQALGHQQAGRFDQAEAMYRAVLAQDARQADALIFYGTLACQTSRHALAVALILEAIKLRPDDAMAHFNLGQVYREMGELALAYPQFQRALYLAPDDINNHVTLASLLDDMRQYKAAIRQFEKMLARWPNHSDIYFYYGLTQRHCGRLDEAMRLFRKAIHLGDDPARNMQAIASLKKFKDDADSDLKVMEDLLLMTDLPDQSRLGLCYALAKAYDSLGVVITSFDYLSRANAIKRKRYSYAVADDAATFDEIKSVFNSELFERYAGCGVSDATPVFVLGMPRSGSSLIEQILSSHPDVVGAGELTDFRQVFLSNDPTLTLANYPAGVAALLETQWQVMGAAYIARLRGHSKTASHIVDKLPHNFLAIGMIHLMLPNARIIHCHRSPVDTCFSIFKTNFAGINSHRYANDLSELGAYYHLYEEMMTYWHSVLPGRILDVSYEALIDNQEAESRRMIEHLNLPWDEACLSFHDNKRAVQTASATQVRKPLYRDAIKAWKRYEIQLAPLIDALSKEGVGA